MSAPSTPAPVEVSLVTSYSLEHLSDQALLHGLAALVARDRATTAELLAHIAEVDERKLYLPAGYPSMRLYCLHELHLCEQAAFKRIRAARTARQFPVVFEALAEGRLHLTAVVVLAPYLTEETVHDLLAVAVHKTRDEIERFLAERFPKPDLLSWVAEPSPLPVPTDQQQARGCAEDQLSPGTVQTPARPIASRPIVTPLSSPSLALQVTIERSTHDKLEYLRDLLSHQIPPGDTAQVLDRAFDLAIEQLEQRRFGATRRPRRHHRPTTSQRHIPAHVRSAVWQRDGGRCTFVSESGRRCPSTRHIEFDHVVEVARGGEATVEGIRLRCRAHNQYTAERTFGAEFMRHKRAAAAEARAAAKARRHAGEAAPADAAATVASDEDDPEHSVVPWLRALGLSVSQARDAAARCRDMTGASLEERVRRALACSCRVGTRAGQGGRGCAAARSRVGVSALGHPVG